MLLAVEGKYNSFIFIYKRKYENINEKYFISIKARNLKFVISTFIDNLALKKLVKNYK